MRKRLCVVLLALGAFAAPTLAASVSVDRTGEEITIGNGQWSVQLSKKQGWEITRIRDEVGGIELRGLFFQTFVRPAAYQVSNSGMVVEEALSARSAGDVAIEVTGAGTDQVLLVRRWKLEFGQVTETTTFGADAPSFDRRVVLSATAPVAEVYAQAQCNDKPMAGRAIHQPEERRSSGGSARMTGLHPYMEAFDPETGVGFGMKPLAGVARMGRYAFGDPERGDDRHPTVRDRNCSGVCVYSTFLTHRQVPAEIELAYTGYLTVSGKRPVAVELPDLELRQAWPKKMIARPEEGNTVRVVIRNNTDAPRNGQLAVQLRCGIDVDMVLEDGELELAPGDTELTIPVDTRHIRYGVEVVTTLTDKVGGKRQTVREYFAVWPRYYRVSPLMEINTPGGVRGVLAKAVAGMRRGYAGVTEVYCWPPDPLFDMTPDTEWFVPGTNSQGSYLVAWSRRHLKDFIDAAHENGIAIMSWTQGTITIQSAMAHPEVVQYNASGKWIADYYRVYKDADRRTDGILDTTFESSDPTINYGDPNVAAMWGDEMGASARMFGWDGVRFDGPAPCFAGAAPVDPLKRTEQNGGYYDLYGRPLGVAPGQSRDELSARNLRRWVEGARKGNPHFELGMNIGHGITMEQEALIENELAYHEWAKSLEYAGQQHAMMLHEGALMVDNPRWNTWRKWTAKLMGTYRVAQKLGSVCTVGHLRWLPSVADRTRAYVAFAAGHRLAYTSSMEHSFGSHEKFNAAEFAVRFGEYLFGEDWELLSNDQEHVQVAGHERLLWRPLVRRRTLAGGTTEWVVHVVNLPADDTICRNHAPPHAREGTVMRLQLQPGQQVTGAWMLLPQPPRAVALEPKMDGGDLVMTLAPIEAFTSVVVRSK